MAEKKSKPKKYTSVIKPTLALQAKVGTGRVPTTTIKRCQALLDNNPYDFTPMGQSIVDRLKTQIDKIRSGEIQYEDAKEKILESVMQLKGNGKMFGYDLVSILATIMMSFLESIDTVNKDAIDIVDAHRRSLDIIFKKKIKGSGGLQGQQFEEELKNACIRYFRVYKSKILETKKKQTEKQQEKEKSA